MDIVDIVTMILLHFKILSLKELGFSLEEIYPLIQDNDKNSFKKSIELQTDLINQKIQKLTALKESLKATEKILTKRNSMG